MIVGLVGGKGVGKTTTANYLVSHLGFKESAFAQPLKEIARIFGFTEKQIYGSQEEKNEINLKNGISARKFMQIFETEIGRNLLPQYFPEMDLGDSSNIWIRLMMSWIKNNPYHNIVVSDIRFLDEVRALRKFSEKVIIIRITRDQALTDYHVSETEYLKIKEDILINNSKGYENLYLRLERAVMDGWWTMGYPDLNLIYKIFFSCYSKPRSLWILSRWN